MVIVVVVVEVEILDVFSPAVVKAAIVLDTLPTTLAAPVLAKPYEQ